MQYLEEVLDIPEISDGTLEVMKNNDIVFDKVNFGYDKRNPGLKTFLLQFRKGSRTAIVGPSVQGKLQLSI